MESSRDSGDAAARLAVDQRHMDTALRLAARGRGSTSPNPMVGAVVLDPGGAVVGEGHHERAGGPHAEVGALDVAGAAARGGTLYCTLEPCRHTGRTGPCVERIVEAGVARVVVAAIDPNPQVGGQGVVFLRDRGLQVTTGVRGVEAARLNEAFLTWITKARPFVIVKIAVSRDGCVAAHPGARTQISGREAARWTHEGRAVVDAIGVGSETVRVDDPQLTARGVVRRRPLVRAVFDRRLRTPPDARLFDTVNEGPVVILTTAEAIRRHERRADQLTAAGAQLEPLGDGGVRAALERLAEREVTSLLLEGGSRLHRAAWRAGVVDRVHRIQSPQVLGQTGVPWIDDEVRLDGLDAHRTVTLGEDVMEEGYVHRIG